MIRLARAEDIPRLQELLGQILIVHHHARPDVFKSEGSKFTDADLEAVINDPNKPIFVYEDEEGRILGHLFLMIKEVSDDNAGAVRFYERLGMKPRYTEMETILK